MNELLVDYSKIGDLPKIKILLEQGVDWEYNNLEALFQASINGHVNVVDLYIKMYLDAGYDFGEEIIDKMLTKAIQNGQTQVVIQYFYRFQELDRSYNHYLGLAVSFNKLEIAHFLLRKYVLYLGHDEQDNSHLLTAIRLENLDMVKLLEEYAIEHRDAIKVALETGNKDTLQYLLTRGYGLNLDERYYTPNLELLEWLFTSGYDNIEYLLMKAIQKNDLHVIKYIIEKQGSTIGQEVKKIILDHIVDVTKLEILKYLTSKLVGLTKEEHEDYLGVLFYYLVSEMGNMGNQQKEDDIQELVNYLLLQYPTFFDSENFTEMLGNLSQVHKSLNEKNIMFLLLGGANPDPEYDGTWVDEGDFILKLASIRGYKQVVKFITLNTKNIPIRRELLETAWIYSNQFIPNQNVVTFMDEYEEDVQEDNQVYKYLLDLQNTNASGLHKTLPLEMLLETQKYLGGNRRKI